MLDACAPPTSRVSTRKAPGEARLDVFALSTCRPSAAGGARERGSGLSATRDSVVSTMAETLAAFSRAQRVTLAGSMMPAETMSQYSSLGIKAVAGLAGGADLLQDHGAIQTGVGSDLTDGSLQGLGHDADTGLSSPSTLESRASTAGITFTKMVPPPATTPSSTAARVAFRASSMRSFFPSSRSRWQRRP